MLLLAVMVLRLGDVLLDSDAHETQTSGRRSHQLASRWAFVFAHLVPLSSLLTAANPGPLPPLQGGSLAERKQQLSEAIAINTSGVSSSLRDQRAETLRTSLPGTLRVLVGAAIVSAFLFLLRRQI